jgi:hypothetical protein
MWCSTHLKGLFALAIVVVVVLASVGLIYTQPWSKVKVIVYNQERYWDLEVVVYLDGTEHARLVIDRLQGGTVGVWPVDQGSHQVAIDIGIAGSSTDPDGIFEYSVVTSVGPLYTKDVYFYVEAPF